MARLLHRVAVFDQAVAADGVVSFDMPVNPLSVILLALRPLNETSTITNYADYRDLCGAITRATLLWRGASLFSMSGLDIVAYNYYRHGLQPMEANADDTDNERRCAVVPLILGRFPYDVSSAVPNSHRGELQLELDLDIADTGYDGLRISAETVELFGAKPKEVERKVTLSQTWAATGDNDIQLPVGNWLRGCLLFGTTGFTGAAPAPSWGRVALHVDGEQIGYAGSDFEVLMSVGQLMGRQPYAGTHSHRVDATAASTTEETIAGSPIDRAAELGNHAFMDLDPTRDDMFSIDLRTAQTAFLRADAETADAIRVVSIEKTLVSDLA